MVDLSSYSVLPAKIAHTPVAVMASMITQFFGRSASSTPNQRSRLASAYRLGMVGRRGKSFDDDAIGAMEGELPANGEEGKEAEDTGNSDDGDVEDGPQILDGGGADESSDE